VIISYDTEPETSFMPFGLCLEETPFSGRIPAFIEKAKIPEVL
jgi:hypothetical protein